MKILIAAFFVLVSMNLFAQGNKTLSERDVRVAGCISDLIPSIPDSNINAHSNPAVKKNYIKLCRRLVDLNMSKSTRFMKCLGDLFPAFPDENLSAHRNRAVMANYNKLCGQIVGNN